MGFGASLARLMIASQVPVTFRPRHLQGLLPSWQLFPRGPTRRWRERFWGFPFRGFPLRRSALRLRRATLLPLEPRQLADFRALFVEDPLEPTLPDPLMGFRPPGSPSPAPVTSLSVGDPLMRLAAPVPREGRRSHSRVSTVPGSAFLSRGSVPSWIFRPCSLLRIFGWHGPRDYGFSSAVPPPEGGFRLLWGRVRPTGVQQGRDLGRANMSW
jgi:hypothetical protein